MSITAETPLDDLALWLDCAGREESERPANGLGARVRDYDGVVGRVTPGGVSRHRNALSAYAEQERPGPVSS